MALFVPTCQLERVSTKGGSVHDIKLSNAFFAIFFGLIFLSKTAYGAPVNKVGKITSTVTGWGGEGYYIVMDTPNGTCGGNYVIQASRNDYKVAVAQAMLAFTQGGSASLWIDGCYNGNAIVISVGMSK